MTIETIQKAEVLPEGHYLGRFKKTENKTISKDERSMWRFEILAGPHKGETALGFTGVEARVTTKRGRFLAWLAGYDKPDADMKVDIFDAMGCDFILEIGIPPGGENLQVVRFWRPEVADNRVKSDVKRTMELQEAELKGEDESVDLASLTESEKTPETPAVVTPETPVPQVDATPADEIPF